MRTGDQEFSQAWPLEVDQDKDLETSLFRPTEVHLAVLQSPSLRVSSTYTLGGDHRSTVDRGVRGELVDPRGFRLIGP